MLAGRGDVEGGLIFQPPGDLTDCLHAAMVNTLPGVDYCLPAGLHPMLLVILRGGIGVYHGEKISFLPRLCLCGASDRAHHAFAVPGTQIFTVALKAEKLRQLFEVQGGELPGAWVGLDEVCKVGDRLSLAHLVANLDTSEGAGRLDIQVAAIFSFLSLMRYRQGSVRRGSVALDFCMSPGMFGWSTRELADYFQIGERQFQRRFLACHGQSFRRFRQQLRFSRMLKQILAHGSQPASLAARAVDGGYYDQAHLNRDILQFTGYTPGNLLQGIAGGGAEFWPYVAARNHLSLLFGPLGY